MTPDETYWDYCSRGELRLQHCAACGQWQFPPSSRCRVCLGTNLPWEPVSGRASTWSWIRMHKRYFDDPAFEPPYLVGMVELEEGPRMVSSISRGADRTDHEFIPRVGEELDLYFDDERDTANRRLPRFRQRAGGVR